MGNKMDSRITAQSNPAPDAAAAAPTSNFLSAKNLTRILKIPLRHWGLSLLCLALCGGLSWMAGKKFSTVSWNLESVLKYEGLPLSAPQRDIFQPDNLTNLSNPKVVKSRENCAAVCGELNFDPALAEVFQRVINVTKIEESESLVTFALGWGDADEGMAILNKLMEVHTRQTAANRKKRIDNYVADLVRDRDKSLEKYKESRTEYDRYLAENQVTVSDPKTEVDRLNKELDSQESALSALRLERGKLTAEYKRLDGFIEEFNAKAKEPKAELPKGEEDSVYFQEKRQLEQLLKATTDQRSETQVEFTRVDKEYERSRKLFPNISREELDRSKAAYDGLRVRLENQDKQIRKCQEDLRFLHRDLAQRKKGDLEKKRRESDDTTAKSENELTARRANVKRLAEIARQAAPLDQKVKESEALRGKLEEQLQVVRPLLAIKENEFRVATPAAVVSGPSSDKKKLMIMAFAVPFVLFFGLMIGYDLLVSARTPSGVADKLGLSVLARFSLRPGHAVSESEARSLALHLRQFVPQSGARVLFSSLNEGMEVDDLTAALSRFLAIRDEKVLILDARLQEVPADGLPSWIDQPAPPESVNTSDDPASALPRDPGAAGLVQYLVFEGQESADFIWPTRIPSVDYLPSGGLYPGTDVLASQPMKDLLDGLTKKYSLILMIGPPVSHTIDTEILAAYVHGMLVILNGPGSSCTPPVESFFASLKETNVAVLGAVLCEP